MSGEGFAFFRWHALNYPYFGTCPGVTEMGLLLSCRARWKHQRLDKGLR
jgi:hypothetical protein